MTTKISIKQDQNTLFSNNPKSNEIKEYFDAFDASMYDTSEMNNLKKEVCLAIVTKAKNVEQTPTQLLRFLTKLFVGTPKFNKFCLENKVFNDQEVKKTLDAAAIQNGFMNFAHFFKRSLEIFPGFNLTLNDLQLSTRNAKQAFQDTLEKNLYRSVLKTHSMQELIENKLKTTFEFSENLKGQQLEDAKLKRLKKVFSDIKFVEYLIENELFITSNAEPTTLYEYFDKALRHIPGAANFAEVLSEYLDQTALSREPKKHKLLKEQVERFQLVHGTSDLADSRIINQYEFNDFDDSNTIISVFDDAFIEEVMIHDSERRTLENAQKLKKTLGETIKSLEKNVQALAVGLTTIQEQTRIQTQLFDYNVEERIRATRLASTIVDRDLMNLQLERNNKEDQVWIKPPRPKMRRL